MLACSAAVPPAVKLLYIAGAPRSGSTMLERLLGDQETLVAAGELRRIWSRGFIANELCSCGQPFRSCPYWGEVLDAAFGGVDGVDAGPAASAVDFDARPARWREVARRVLPATARNGPDLLAEILPPLYRGILSVSGASAVIDSSKDTTYGLVLSALEDLEVRVVHLVRDSRAVAYSWQRKRRRPEIVDREEYMPVARPTSTAVGWTMRNMTAEGLRLFADSYVRLRYEDLVADPDGAISRIVGPLADGQAGDEAREAREARSSAGYHTVSGNPMRLAKGPLKVSADVEWKAALPPRDRATVTALSLPLLLRYGYPPVLNS